MMLETSAHPELVPVAISAARYPSLAGRGVFITGGASSIGMHLVHAFADQGARVAFVDLDAEAAKRVADVCAGELGNRPAWREVDLRDIDALRRAISELRAEVGPFVAVVNNAGNDDRKPALELSVADWDDRMAVNLRHQFFAAQIAHPDLAAARGAVINMGSNAWMQGAGGMVAYTTAKAAVMGLTKSLAREWGRDGIRVNSIAPGWILTERQVTRAKAIYPDKFADYLRRQCIAEFLLPPDVARMALFLAADDSRLITGQTFIVDGGVV